MTQGDIKIFFELLKDENYCLLYNGNFVDSITSKIINITKVSLIQRGESIKIQNRFSFLIAECFQNIIRHGGHKEQNTLERILPGFFMAKIRGSQYCIVTGNLIDKRNISPLKKQFDTINALPEDKLKELYKKVMANGRLSEKGGAGLGLIDMAKKTSNDLEYEFIDNTETHSMFYNRLVMNTFTGDEISRVNFEDGIDFGIQIHNAMMKHNVLILRKSDFSKDSVKPMLEIVENNIKKQNPNKNTVEDIYYILIDLLLNISNFGLKYGDKDEGVFLISKQGNTYKICSGNYIDNRKVTGFKKFMASLKNKNADELKDFYVNRLKHINNLPAKIETDTIMDIGNLLYENFSFDFFDIDEDVSFFSICATF